MKPKTPQTKPAAAPSPAAIAARSLIRDVMRSAPDRGFSEEALHTQARKLDASLSEDDTKAALQWNFKRGNVNFEFNSELEADLWKLTTRGLHADDAPAA
jgi:hypothetical protein